jgi:hypothetical protein
MKEVSPLRTTIQSLAAKVMNLMNLAKVANISSAGVMAMFGFSVSPRHHRAGLAGQR